MKRVADSGRRSIDEAGSPDPRARISVVIPALDEECEIGRAIESARAEGTEILVVDGGSRDRTADIAASLGARVVRGPRGRGSQLAAGALAATGDVLLFLHADARLPAGYREAVLEALSGGDLALGAFRLRIDARGMGYRLIEWGVRARCRVLSAPYGDQALFARAETYRRIGGFRPLEALEDLDIVARARRFGRIRTLPQEVLVSARAWRRDGWIRVTTWNLFCALCWAGGVSAARIARWRTGRAAAGPGRGIDGRLGTGDDAPRASDP
ncbi:MAG: TIGR04283 family arsenosugar biosynthesis glycosyltransferase [Planctomycetota bacterium]